MAMILLVDDEPSILSILTTLLEAEGHNIVSATHGEKAQDLIVSQEFDLMISDIRMSPISGMDLLRFVHKERPDVAVIMLTAYGQVETAVESLQLGAFDYVKKPFRADHLLETVKKKRSNARVSARGNRRSDFLEMSLAGICLPSPSDGAWASPPVKLELARIRSQAPLMVKVILASRRVVRHWNI